MVQNIRSDIQGGILLNIESGLRGWYDCALPIASQSVGMIPTLRFYCIHGQWAHVGKGRWVKHNYDSPLIIYKYNENVPSVHSDAHRYRLRKRIEKRSSMARAFSTPSTNDKHIFRFTSTTIRDLVQTVSRLDTCSLIFACKFTTTLLGNEFTPLEGSAGETMANSPTSPCFGIAESCNLP